MLIPLTLTNVNFEEKNISSQRDHEKLKETASIKMDFENWIEFQKEFMNKCMKENNKGNMERDKCMRLAGAQS